jgi:hypothetical protein
MEADRDDGRDPFGLKRVVGDDPSEFQASFCWDRQLFRLFDNFRVVFRVVFRQLSENGPQIRDVGTRRLRILPPGKLRRIRLSWPGTRRRLSVANSTQENKGNNA